MAGDFGSSPLLSRFLFAHVCRAFIALSGLQRPSFSVPDGWTTLVLTRLSKHAGQVSVGSNQLKFRLTSVWSVDRGFLLVFCQISWHHHPRAGSSPSCSCCQPWPWLSHQSHVPIAKVVRVIDGDTRGSTIAGRSIPGYCLIPGVESSPHTKRDRFS